jgi:hypothetical protein
VPETYQLGAIRHTGSSDELKLVHTIETMSTGQKLLESLHDCSILFSVEQAFKKFPCIALQNPLELLLTNFLVYAEMSNYQPMSYGA